MKTKEEIVSYLSALALELYPDSNWSGLQYGSLEWLMTQLVAEASDLNGSYIDARANQAYLNTATVRQDIRDLAGNLGYEVVERTGAVTTLSVTGSSTFYLPKGSSATTSTGLVFSTLNALQDTGTVDAIHASYKQIVTSAIGRANETISLDEEDVLVENIGVTVDAVAFTRVASFASSESTDKHFIVEFDETGKAYLVFGSGVYGSRLEADQEVVIDVYFGGGVAGNNVPIGAITAISSSFDDSAIVTAVSNTTISSGGRGPDTVADVSAGIAGRLESIAGLVSPKHVSNVLKNYLSWVQDATITSDGTVYVLPESTVISDMSGAQAIAVADYIEENGLIGLDFQVKSALEAGIELGIEVELVNKSLRAQKTSEIMGVLFNNSDAVFAFDTLKFSRKVVKVDIEAAIKAISGIKSCSVTKFRRILSSIVMNETDSVNDFVLDAEIGLDLDDGYWILEDIAPDAWSCDYCRSIIPVKVGPNYIETNDNWLVHEWTLTDLDDTNGPYVKVLGDKLVVKQLEYVLATNALTGSTWDQKTLIRAEWLDDNDVAQEAFYHVESCALPGVITTSEDADSPIYGTGLTSGLQDREYVKIQVFKDLGNDDSVYSYLEDPNAVQYTILANTANRIYLDTLNPAIPLKKESRIRYHDDEEIVDGSSGGFVTDNGALRMRTAEITGEGEVRIYNSKLNPSELSYKHPSEIWNLTPANFNLVFKG